MFEKNNTKCENKLHKKVKIMILNFLQKNTCFSIKNILILPKTNFK